VSPHLDNGKVFAIVDSRDSDVRSYLAPFIRFQIETAGLRAVQCMVKIRRCVCVREKERERGKESEGEREKGRQRERERERERE
jgi:hypothetical protein